MALPMLMHRSLIRARLPLRHKAVLVYKVTHIHTHTHNTFPKRINTSTHKYNVKYAFPVCDYVYILTKRNASREKGSSHHTSALNH